MQYKISIIIPIHNIEKYLEQTLDSLIKQTIGFENLEIIMVNDCSTDNSKEIIDKYACKYNNFIAVHLTENSGLPGKPRNIGLEMATGEYVMFMDHDDYYSDDACEVFYNKITEENVDIVFSRFNYVFGGGNTRNNTTLFGDINEIKVNAVSENKLLLEIGPTIWTKIFRRSFIMENNIRFPEGILAEDLSFVVQSFLKAKGIVYLNNYFSYNYRIRNSNNEKSTIYIRNKKYLRAMIKGYYDTYNVLKDQKQEKYFPIIFKRNLQYWLDCLILSDINPSEKMELLKEIAFLFETKRKYGDLDKFYLPLFNDIISGRFEEAVLLSEVMADFKKMESDLRRLSENQKNLQNQLSAKKKQVAELQTTGGWLQYKTNNIHHRIKIKLKFE